MIFIIFSMIALVGAFLATFLYDVRGSILALWVTGLGVGGLFLSMGAEVLAIILWIVSTLVAISFMFYAVTFGEYGIRDSRPWKNRLIAAILPVLCGGLFVTLIWLGSKDLVGDHFARAVTLKEPIENLQILGEKISKDHLLALEILGLCLFLVVVGTGVVSRPEVIDS